MKNSNQTLNISNLGPEEKETLMVFENYWKEQKDFLLNRRRSQWQFKNSRKKTSPLKRITHTPLTPSSRWTSDDELSFQIPANLLQKREGSQPKQSEAQGILHVRFSLGNTHLNLRNMEGKTVLHFSAGSLKSWKKSSPTANYLIAQKCGQLALQKGIRRIFFESHGLSRQRKIFFKGLKESGLKILRITLNPGLPHNGCRPSKKRRL